MMLRRLARLLWRLLPDRARFAFAVEAPMVLTYDIFSRHDGTTEFSWLRGEEHFYPVQVFEELIKFREDDEDSRLLGWAAQRAQRGGPFFPTQEEAFQVLTAALKRDPKVVLARLQFDGEHSALVPFEE